MRKNRICSIGIYCLFLLSACAPNTQDLIDQAQLTGDWSFVNKRIATLERLEPHQPQSCPGGTRRFCVSRMGKEKCSCVENSDFRDMLESFGL